MAIFLITMLILDTIMAVLALFAAGAAVNGNEMGFLGAAVGVAVIFTWSAAAHGLILCLVYK